MTDTDKENINTPKEPLKSEDTNKKDDTPKAKPLETPSESEATKKMDSFLESKRKQAFLKRVKNITNKEADTSSKTKLTDNDDEQLPITKVEAYLTNKRRETLLKTITTAVFGDDNNIVKQRTDNPIAINIKVLDFLNTKRKQAILEKIKDAQV